MNSKVDKAVSLFNQGFDCSQSILSAYCEQFGLEREKALKIASGFGGGMGAMAQTCGAVTGAFMAIGLKYGSTSANIEAKLNTYKLVREFVEEFESRNGTIVCKELLVCDISTEEGYHIAKEKGLFSSRCPEFVRDATEIIEQMFDSY